MSKWEKQYDEKQGQTYLAEIKQAA
jgi:proton glutamate symport protein